MSFLKFMGFSIIRIRFYTDFHNRCFISTVLFSKYFLFSLFSVRFPDLIPNFQNQFLDFPSIFRDFPGIFLDFLGIFLDFPGLFGFILTASGGFRSSTFPISICSPKNVLKIKMFIGIKTFLYID